MIHLVDNFYLASDSVSLTIVKKVDRKHVDGTPYVLDINIAYGSTLKQIMFAFNDIVAKKAIDFNWDEHTIILIFKTLEEKIDQISTHEFNYPFVLLKKEQEKDC